MASDLPDLFDAAQKFVVALRDKYIAAKADGQLSFAEVVDLGSDAVRFLVDQAALLSVAGVEKKKLVLDAFERVYDLLEPLIDVPYVPAWIEAAAIKPWLRQLAMLAASGIVETFVRMLPEREKTMIKGAA